MREIIFRGKRIDNGEWVEGGYYKHTQRQICPVGDILTDDDICHLIIKSGFADWNMPKPLQAFEVLPETVGQYTGLTDKNGKKIFEGDIVSSGKFIGVVKYNEVIASFVAEINDTTEKYYHWSPLNEGDVDRIKRLQYTEIIGNIHDNPELKNDEKPESSDKNKTTQFFINRFLKVN